MNLIIGEKMRISLVLLLLLFSFGPQNVQAESCGELVNGIFKGRKTPFDNVPEFKLMEKVEKLEDVTNKIRNWKENPEPAINIKYNKVIAELDNYLIQGQYAVNHREWRGLFRKVEFAFSIVEKNKKALSSVKGLTDEATSKQVDEALKKAKLSAGYRELLVELFEGKGSISGLRASLELENNSRLVDLGSNYHYYKMVREHLEDMLDGNACDKNCKESTAKLLDSMGISYDKEMHRYARLFNKEKRPSLDALSKMLNENSVALITRLKKERNEELFALIKSFVLQPYFVNKIFKGIYNTPGINKKRWVRVFKIVYNTQARVLHFPKINKLTRFSGTAKDKFHFLKEINSTVDADEILVTLGRRVDQSTVDIRNDIFKYAKANDTDFYERLVKAKEKAKARGDISLTYEKSFVAKLASIIALGGGATYFYMFKEDSKIVTMIEEEIEDAQEGIKDELNIQIDSEEDDFLDEMQDELIEEVPQSKKQSSHFLHEFNRKPASIGVWEKLKNFFKN